MKAVRSWYIDASGPPEGQHKWRKRIQISVLADNAQHALIAFREAYPNAEVWVIRHEGQRLVLDGFTVALGDTQLSRRPTRYIKSSSAALAQWDCSPCSCGSW